MQASGTRVRLSHLIAWCASTVRLVDIPLDPLPGALMDNTRSRFGKFRPWMLAGAQSRLR